MDGWYFAYGSNLWMDQMIERTGAIGHAEHRPRIARLANHRLIFQCLANGGPAFANIVSPGDGVLGVVYRCSDLDLERLDCFERGYERGPIEVTDPTGEALVAIAYIITPDQAWNQGQPTAAYLDRIVTGARQHGLPEKYIESIITSAALGVI